MRPPGFAEAILQNIIRSFKKENAYFQPRSSQGRELFIEIGQELAFANIDHECGTPDSFFLIGSHEAPEGRQHRYRKIIDAEVSEVLERVGGRRHSGAAQAGDDYNVRD